jgi:hypothetical protein
MLTRPDYIFSYWIFVWYLLYIVGVKTYNPKFALIIGTIANLCILLLMLYYNTRTKLIILFIVMMAILKLIPLTSIWSTKIYSTDIIATGILFIIYLGWIHINKKTIFNFTHQTYDLVIHNKNTLPGMTLFTKLGLSI